MDNYIEKLAEYFKEFPGIGERQAKRFVYFLLRKNPEYVNGLANKILDVKEYIKQCPQCFLFFQSNNNRLCEVCSSNKTDQTSLLIVEKDADYENIRRSKTYNGLYFILGGLVPIVTKETPHFVRITELINYIEKLSQENKLKEIILALSLSPQGEHTDLYLREKINPLKNKYNFKIVSLGRGLSTGIELEYSDSETLKNALNNRS